MKLATIRDGSRDGQLAVVARDLKSAHMADAICPTLQAALDDWAFIAPQLEALSTQLNAGQARRAFDFDPTACMAPLPRACQVAIGAARTGQAPPDEPMLYQAAGCNLLGPMDDIVLAQEAWGIDCEAGLAAIVDDLPMGVTPSQAHDRIRLLMLANHVLLRQLMPGELASGVGFLHSRPLIGFSPLALTPDELGDAWRGGKLHLPLRSTRNGKLGGQPDAGAGMAFNFPHLISHLCKTRTVGAGSIVGASPIADEDGGAEPAGSFMHFGDTVRVDMLDAKGKSLFGAIEQTVRKP